MTLKYRYKSLATVIAAVMVLPPVAALASSHNEAPGISKTPKLDGTDLYMFNSYEPGRNGYVTILANYNGLQSPEGGPNYFNLDSDGLYEIEFDNVGDGKAHLTFQFQFTNTLANNGTGLSLTIGGVSTPVAVKALVPPAGASNTTVNTGETESYTLTVVQGDRRTGTRTPIINPVTGGTSFVKPIDNIGSKTIPNYNAYANQFIYTFSLASLNIPGCTGTGRVFVGQRADGFSVNLGPVFDNVNFVPIDGPDQPDGIPIGIVQNTANDEVRGKKNVDTLALELPAACIASSNGVVGAFTTSSIPQARLLNPSARFESTAEQGGAYVQVSRLGNPLFNELIIGLPAKDGWNASDPIEDGMGFRHFVDKPTYPEILNLLFGGPVDSVINLPAGTDISPQFYPRLDLEAIFLVGFPNVNQLPTVTPSDMLRLNTQIPAVPKGSQNPLGVIAGDVAGYPNGRRPGDNVTDITLRAAMGVLCYPIPLGGKPTNLGICSSQQAVSGFVPYTDGAPIHDTDFMNVFPYLNPPIPGAPGHDARIPQ